MRVQQRETTIVTLTPAVHGPNSHCNFYLCIRHFRPLFFHSHPVYAPSYQCTVPPTRSPDFCPTKKRRQQTLLKQTPKKSRPRGEEIGMCSFFSPLYPSGFASCANPALCSSPRQHPLHRHLPLGARLLSSGRLETAVPKRGKDLHTAPLIGGRGERSQ